MRATEVCKSLSARGWRLVEHHGDADNFGNECLVMAKAPVHLRLTLDRGFEHVDLARAPVASETDWTPLEVAALAAGLIAEDDVLQCCRDACHFEHDTGSIEARPLFEKPEAEVQLHFDTYADILKSPDRVTRARTTVMAITEQALSEIHPDPWKDPD